MKFIFFVFVITTLIIPITSAHAMRDPFFQQNRLSCLELAEEWRSQLETWKFQGIVYTSTMHYQQIWLTQSSTLLTVYSLDDPTLLHLHPWYLQQVSSQQLTWRAELPAYCQKTLIFTMPFED